MSVHQGPNERGTRSSTMLNVSPFVEHDSVFLGERCESTPCASNTYNGSCTGPKAVLEMPAVAEEEQSSQLRKQRRRSQWDSARRRGASAALDLLGPCLRLLPMTSQVVWVLLRVVPILISKPRCPQRPSHFKRSSAG